MKTGIFFEKITFSNFVINIYKVPIASNNTNVEFSCFLGFKMNKIPDGNLEVAAEDGSDVILRRILYATV